MRRREMAALLRRMDWLLVAATALLLIAGICAIYSAAWRGDDQPVSPFYQKQIVWALGGGACFLSLALVPYRRWWDAAGWLYAATLVLLVLVLLMGRKVYGAYRWLSLFGIQVQPAEFAKLTLVLALARLWGDPDRARDDLRGVFYTLLLAGVPFVLILKQPDLGSALMLLPPAACILYAAGVPRRTLVLLLLLGVCLLPVGWFCLGDYQRERLLVFWEPGRDPYGSGWNKLQSQIAVGSGGWHGKGWLQGTQNVLGYLPRTVAPTDFIYSVIAEEFGFVGSAALVALFAVVLFACGRGALAARDRFGRLLAVGVAGLLFGHVFVNIAMTIGLLPITGLPLPLISYGGSFMLSTMAALGLTQSVYARRFRR